MQKRDMAIAAALLASLVAFSLNMPEEGYLKFVDLRPIAESQIAKVLDGDTQDCLTVPSQTRPVPMSLALKLEGKTTRQVLKELPEYYCQGKKGAIDYVKYMTDSAKPLYVLLDKSLDEPIKYGFTPPEADTSAKAETRGSPASRSVPVPRKAGSESNPMEKR